MQRLFLCSISKGSIRTRPFLSAKHNAPKDGCDLRIVYIIQWLPSARSAYLPSFIFVPVCCSALYYPPHTPHQPVFVMNLRFFCRFPYSIANHRAEEYRPAEKHNLSSERGVRENGGKSVNKPVP